MTDTPTQGFRLSPQQRRLWLLGGTARPYRLRLRLRLEGELRPEALERALQGLVERHEILRTELRSRTGIRWPFQVVRERGRVHLENRELGSAATGEAIETAIETAIESAFRETGEGLEARLFALGDARHLLVVELPALAADPPSAAIACRELAALYAAATGADESLAEAAQYADFSEVFNELLEDPEMEEARSYWRRHDLGSRVSQSLPGLRRAEDGADFEPRSSAVPFDAERLGGTLESAGLEPAAFFFAAWQAFLRRLTGEAVVVGTGFAGRGYEELEEAVGPYARYLPLSLETAEDGSFSSLVEKAGRALEEAAEWQEFFSWDPPSDTAAPGFFPLGFDWADLTASAEGGGVDFVLDGVGGHFDRFDLRLAVASTAAGPRATLHYDARRFEKAAADRLAAGLARLLEHAAGSPETALGELELLGPGEAGRLLELGAGEEVDETELELVHRAFERWAERHPERPAVSGPDGELSYGELDRRANRLAHLLREHGAGPEVLVGLCASRSAAMVVGLLGVLKAGSAYVPFEADQPKDRIARTLQAVGCRLFLTSPELAGDFGDFEGEVLSLDAGAPELADPPEERPAALERPENLAYVIFTSGSTGEPKGVMISHRSLAAYTRFLRRLLDLDEGPGARFAMVSTFAADLGHTAIFPALGSGSSLEVLDYALATDGARLAEHARERPIDVLKIVPSHLQALLAWPEIRTALPRRALILGGELFPRELFEAIAPRVEGALINHYGPTETTVGSLVFDAGRAGAELTGAAGVPIGRPIGGTRIHVVDRRGRPSFPGAAGELAIGGLGVARGYLGRAAETAQRFVPDPFSGRRGERLYRTGDCVRFGADGVVEFLGRVDDQLKIHGFRVEPGEISAVLAEHPSVERAVVVAREPAAGGPRRLVAYTVAEPGAEAPTPEAWRRFLGERLPDYMIPAAFVALGELPLTANGKLDRRALPEPDWGHRELDADYRAPESAEEKALCEIWARLLGREKVGVDDNFFALGGDSILSIQMVVEARDAGLELAPVEVFQRPTVAELTRSARAGEIRAEPASASARVELDADQMDSILETLEEGR